MACNWSHTKNATKKFFSLLSFGKIFLLFSFKGSNIYSHWAGGIISVLVTLAFLAYSMIRVNQVIHKEHYNIEYQYKYFTELNYNTFGRFFELVNP